jgi:hypothetical protein
MLLFFLTFVPKEGFTNSFLDNRAPNDYYISGDSFRAYCDFTYDEVDSSLNPLEVKEGNVIFVKTDYLSNFFKKIHPKITCKYIIVTHNSDESSPGKYLNYLEDKKIIAWFAQNIDYNKNKKMIPIPIGIANKCWPHGNVAILDKIKNLNYPKKQFLYLNISSGTYPDERKKVLSLFKNKNYCLYRERVDFESYCIDVSSSIFVISVRGNGLDTHRFWESLYLGAIPIVKTSSLDSLYKDLDLPVLIIDDWESVTEEFLKEKYKEMQNRSYNLEKLDIKYWYNLIDSYK